MVLQSGGMSRLASEESDPDESVIKAVGFTSRLLRVAVIQQAGRRLEGGLLRCRHRADTHFGIGK